MESCHSEYFTGKKYFNIKLCNETKNAYLYKASSFFIYIILNFVKFLKYLLSQMHIQNSIKH